MLVSHAEVEGRGRDVVVVKKRWLDDPHFQAVLLGHIHHQEVCSDAGSGNVFYSGALERLGLDEASQTPGFWLHTIADGKLVKPSRSVPTSEAAAHSQLAATPRPMYQLHLAAANMADFELDAAVKGMLDKLAIDGGLSGSIVHLTLTDVSSLFRQSGLEQIWQQHFREAGGFYLEIDGQTELVASMLDPRIPPVKDVYSGFLAFLEAQEFDNDAIRVRRTAEASEVMLFAREKLAAAEEVD